MHTYFGSKIIHAMPMNRQAYNDYRGWELPADENGEDEGYLVEYLDGGEPNHPDHEGYISWSPTRVFEDAYTDLGETQGMELRKIRMMAERAQLSERLVKLRDFIGTQVYRALPTRERHLLSKQCRSMYDYLVSLEERLAL